MTTEIETNNTLTATELIRAAGQAIVNNADTIATLLDIRSEHYRYWAVHIKKYSHIHKVELQFLAYDAGTGQASQEYSTPLEACEYLAMAYYFSEDSSFRWWQETENYETRVLQRFLKDARAAKEGE